MLPGTTYTLGIEDGAFLDTSGSVINDILSGLADSTFTTVADTIAPDIVGNISILDGAIDVAVDAGISFDLGETVTAVAGKNITLTDGDGNVITIAADDETQVSILGGVVTIKPTNDLLTATNYTVAIEDGAFIDLGDNLFDGILADDGALNFTTEAINIPDITGTISILDGAEDVAVDANISLNLGEAVTAVSGKNITLTPIGGGDVITIAVDDTTQVSILGDLVTINPNNDLLSGTEYTLEIDSGAFINGAVNAVDDILNGLLGDGALNFTTVADMIAPVITGDISILDGAEDVAVDAGISFDLGETVTAVSGKKITLTPIGGGEVIEINADDTTQVSILGGLVTIKTTNDLLPDTGYTLAIESGAFIDLAGNLFDGIVRRYFELHYSC